MKLGFIDCKFEFLDDVVGSLSRCVGGLKSYDFE